MRFTATINVCFIAIIVRFIATIGPYCVSCHRYCVNFCNYRGISANIMGFIVAAYNVYMYYIVPIVSEFLELLCDLDITTGILAQCHELPRKAIKIIPPPPQGVKFFRGKKFKSPGNFMNCRENRYIF